MIASRATTISTRLNLAYVVAIVAGNLLLFVGLPLLIAADGAGWAWAAPFLVLTVVPHWALIHEAIHGHLHPNPEVDQTLGRLLAVLFCAPYDTLRFGHLSHHALNARPPDRPEVYDPATRSRLRAALGYYPRLMLGLFLVEFISGPLSLLPRRALRPIVRSLFYDGSPDAAGMADRAERQLLEPSRLNRIRREAVAIIALITLGMWLWGALWPVLVAALIGRGFLISVLDNAPHYEGPLADPDQGYDMAAPGGLSLAVLNSNYHGVHHSHPNLPWTALPDTFSAEGRRFHGNYLVTPWRQFRGPLPLVQAAAVHRNEPVRPVEPARLAQSVRSAEEV